MIKFCRACIKLCLLAIWTVCLTLGYYPVFLILPTKSYKTRWQQLIKKIWAKGSLFILRVRLTFHYVDEQGNTIDKSSIYQGTWSDAHFCVSNHCSYLDIPILLSFLPGRFIAKHEVKDWPVIGLLTQIYGTLFIHRERLRSLLKLNNHIEQLFRDNPHERIWLFPEGTTSDGKDVLPYMPSLLRIIEKKHPDIPVYNSVLNYKTGDTDPPAEDSVCWWREGEAFGPHAWEMLKLNCIEAELTLFINPFLANDRKKLAQELQTVSREQIQKKQDRSPALEPQM